MGELKIGNATYGRDRRGIDALKANLKGDIDRAMKALDEYKNFIQTVESNWSGPDSAEFVDKFIKSVTQIKSEFKKYKIQIDRALEADATQFYKMQSSNASTISGKIKKIN